jgi:AcrR family transcriptional regulator
VTASNEPSTRERIVSEAMKLFAQRGYRGTTVGEIEQAAGLSPRSGGVYKHFRSKEDVLAAGIERHVSEIETMRSLIELMPLGDLRAELTLLARWALTELGAEQDLMRVVQKDGDQFPELVAEVSERIINPGHRQAVEVIEHVLGGADAAGRDIAAIAAVAIGSLVAYRVEERMFGVPPGGVDAERFIEAWVDVWVAFAEAAGVDTGTTRQEPARQ